MDRRKKIEPADDFGWFYALIAGINQVNTGKDGRMYVRCMASRINLIGDNRHKPANTNNIVANNGTPSNNEYGADDLLPF